MPLEIKTKNKLTKDALQIKLNKSISTLESNYYINHVCLAYSKIKCLDEICKAILTNKTALFRVEKYHFGCQNNSSLNNSSAEWLNICHSEEAKIFFELFNTFKMPMVYIKRDSSNCTYTPNMETHNLNRDFGSVIDINSVETNKSIIPFVPSNLTDKVGKVIMHVSAERVYNFSIRSYGEKKIKNSIKRKNKLDRVRLYQNKCGNKLIIRKKPKNTRIKKVINKSIIVPINTEIHETISKVVLAHDFNHDALKLMKLKHFSPPVYWVNAVDTILNYLITNKRKEELHKIQMCLQRQEYLYKDAIIVEKIVSISKLINDEKVSDGVKIYVLNSLQMILYEQEKLHKKMGINPVISHINLFA